MRIVNMALYVVLLAGFLLWIQAGKGKKRSKEMQWLREHGWILLLLFVINSISFAITFYRQEKGIYIEKGGYKDSEQQIELQLEKGETTEQFYLNVRQKMLTEEEWNAKIQEAFHFLEEHMQGENPSLQEVRENLDFSIDYEMYPFDVEVQPEDYSLMDEDGCLKNSEEQLKKAGYKAKSLLEGISTKVTIILWYGEKSQEKTYEILIFPREQTGIEELFFSVKEKLEQKEGEALYEDGFSLPVQVDGVEISMMDSGGISASRVLFFGFILAGLLLLREKENEKQAENKRKEMLKRCYPWFVNELVLLSGAGMQMKNIIYILVQEYEEEKRRDLPRTQKKGFHFFQKKEQEDDRGVLIEELRVATHNMEVGMSEEQVYYQLGRRLKLPCYIKLMTLLEQNVKRGMKGLAEAFEQEELAALEERKNLAKRYGEEAGTKLLGPMVLLLLVVMLMIIVPAFLSLAV